MLPKVQGGDLISYSQLIHILADMQRADAFDLLSMMINEGTYHQLCFIWSRIQDYQFNLCLLCFAGIQPNEVTFLPLFKLCGSMGDVDKAFQIIEMMKRAGVDAGVYSYSALIDVCATHMPEKGIQVLETMTHEGIEPNIITYSSLIKGFSRLGDAHGAYKIWRTMKERNVELRLDTCASLISVLSSCDQMLDHAYEIAVEIAKYRSKFNLFVYNSLFGLYAQSKDYSKALELWQAMRSSRLKPDAFTYYNLISSCTHQEDSVATTIGLLKNMKEDKISPTTAIFAAIAGICLQQGTHPFYLSTMPLLQSC